MERWGEILNAHPRTINKPLPPKPLILTASPLIEVTLPNTNPLQAFCLDQSVK